MWSEDFPEYARFDLLRVGNGKKSVAPTALAILTVLFPALTRLANFYRASGA